SSAVALTLPWRPNASNVCIARNGGSFLTSPPISAVLVKLNQIAISIILIAAGPRLTSDLSEVARLERAGRRGSRPGKREKPGLCRRSDGRQRGLAKF